MSVPHVLVLGGTGEARLLARRLVRDGLRVTLSLAGRTRHPVALPCAVRSGGFGGAQGLAAFLREHGVAVLADATHPFATQISENAETAAALARVPLIALERRPWEKQPGDRWTPARDMEHAAVLLGDGPRRVFLAIGRQELAPFSARPQHAYVVRSVEPVAERDRMPRARFILGRGPFAEKDERALLLDHGVEIVVAKNSGGAATRGKIAAARSLGIEVVMVSRPRPPAADAVLTIEEAVEKIVHVSGLPAARGE